MHKVLLSKSFCELKQLQQHYHLQIPLAFGKHSFVLNLNFKPQCSALCSAHCDSKDFVAQDILHATSFPFTYFILINPPRQGASPYPYHAKPTHLPYHIPDVEVVALAACRSQKGASSNTH